MALADLGEPRPIVVGRNQRTRGRAADRLGDHRRDRLGTRAEDRRLDLVHARGATRGQRLAERTAPAVAGRRLGKIGEPRLQADAPFGVTADGERRERGAVVGELATDHLPALRLALAREVRARDAQRGVDRLRATAGERHAREPARQPRFEQALDQSHAALGRKRRDHVGRALRLARVGLGHLVPAVADVHHDRAAGGVEDLLTLVGVEPDAFAARDAQRRRAGLGREREAPRALRLHQERPTSFALSSQSARASAWSCASGSVFAGLPLTK